MLCSRFRIVQILTIPFLTFLLATPAQATLDEALLKGNPSLLPAQSSEIVDAALKQIDLYQRAQSRLLNATYGNLAINYAPGNRTQLINIKENERVFPLLKGNAGNNLAAFGSAGGGRFAAYGSVPMNYFLGGTNLDHEEPFKRVLGWLFSGVPGDTSSLAQTKNIALTYTGATNSTITKWFGKQAATWKTQVCNDPATISSCYQNKDLLILSWESYASTSDNQTVLNAIKTHLALHKPVLYLHTWYEPISNFSNIVSDFLGFDLPYGGNYWSNDSANHTDLNQMQAGQSAFAEVQRMLQHFQKQDYNFNWSLCTSRDCSSMTDLVKEFYSGARIIRNQVATWESKNLDIFRQGGRKLSKLLVLLGDKYRSTIKYPLEKNNTTLLQGLYADHATYITRRINPAQPDLGTFSGVIPSTTPVQSKLVSLFSHRSQIDSTTGYYALPGRTVTLVRKDTSAVKVYAHLNNLRNGTSTIWNKFDRPMFLSGTWIPLETGKPVRLTSPYGGIVFLGVKSSESPEKITVAVYNVLRQPIFTGNNVDEFNLVYANTPLDWVEIKTPNIQLREKLSLFKQTFNSSLIAGDIKKLYSLIETYLYKDLYGLAGYVGRGLIQPKTIQAFCSAHSWDCTSPSIHGMDWIQQINDDRPLCGDGCSGNPYDQDWAFDPIGWGESHEIGHNLQIDRLKIYGDLTTEVSNNIFPLHKMFKFYNAGIYNKAAKPSSFDILQAAALTTTPIESARVGIWSQGRSLDFYKQVPLHCYYAKNVGDSGWDIYRLMYIHDRLLSQALANDTTWAEQRTKLGFSQYTNRIGPNGNDFMLISMSYITGLDQRPFFDQWGVTYSAQAANQVASYGFKSATKQYWVVPKGELSSYPPIAVPIDGISSWPY